MSTLSFQDLGISTKTGRQRYATTCPKCNHTREKHRNAQCLTVNDEPGNRWYKCNHPTCGWSGNLDAGDKYDQVRNNARLPERKAEAYTKQTREYLQKRGFSTKTALTAEVYETADGKGRTLICFPFYMNHTLVNVKFFNLSWKPGSKGPKWFQLKKDYGTKTMFLGMQLLTFDTDSPNKPKRVIITEGEWDMLTWKECGYNNALSVPQGAPSDKAKEFSKEFAYLQDPYVKSVLDDVQLFYLSVDADAPGKLLMDNLAMILGKSKCRIIKYPPGYKDINEVYVGHEAKKLKALGQEGVDECMQNAASFPLKGVIKASDVRAEMKLYREDGFTPGLGIGIPEVDRLFTLKRKHVTFITGVPGSGKSIYARWHIVELIRHNIDLDLKWALFTPENRPVSREYARIAEVIAGANIKTGTPNSMSEIQYQKAMKFIERHFFLVSPDRKNYESFGGKVEGGAVNTLQSVMQYVAYLKKTENIFGFLLDAWNKIEFQQSRNMTETQFISQQLDHLIEFCDYYDVHGMVVVHPRKIENQGQNYKMPSMYDIKGSSAWKEKADIGIIAHRYKYRKRTNEELPPNPDDDDLWEPVY
ncbi:hypothetical protein LCGC14_1312720, partial [marine sediment metagenome]